MWDAVEEALYWIDVRAPALHRLHHRLGTVSTWAMPDVIGAFALVEGGGVVAALRSGVLLLDLVTGRQTLLARPEADRPQNRLNDGAVSPCGCYFVFGSMDDRPERAATGALYCLDAQGGCRRIADGFCVSNGLAFSHDGRTLYHSDSHRGVIFVWDFDVDAGTVSRRRIFAHADEARGRPDGAALDAQGNYWSAGVSAGVLNCFSPDGNLLHRLQVPARFPTMPAFGGPALDTLFVTSLVRAGTPVNACDGRLMEFASPVAGVARARFRLVRPRGA